jgi:hypothetical protein
MRRIGIHEPIVYSTAIGSSNAEKPALAIQERIIEPKIADDGSIHYSSVMSAPDDSIAVCYMVPDRVIPVVFVPGVMGTNLESKGAAGSNRSGCSTACLPSSPG